MTVSRAAIARAAKALADAGVQVKGARLHPDGSVSLLTEGEPLPSPANDAGDWVDLAGEDDAPKGPGVAARA